MVKLPQSDKLKTYLSLIVYLLILFKLYKTFDIFIPLLNSKL
jgi:hypothetical protein